MDQYQLIRHLFAVEGLSQREIARRLGISRNTVARYCEGRDVPWETKTSVRKPRVITPEVEAFVRRCFDEDRETNQPKQKHTAKRIYDRLCEIGFRGGESTIRRLVREMKAKLPQVYLPLTFAPGEAAQVDWGAGAVIMNGRKIEANLFCIRLCFSCAPFVVAYPSQREEVFLEAHREAFEFFGGAPRALIYDNLKTAVKEGWGKTAREQEKFLALRAHYAYETRFCNLRKSHEKGLVENLVGYSRRNFLVPIPRVESWAELNHLLRDRCCGYIESHHIRGRDLTVKEAFTLEQRALIPLPVKPYEAVKMAEGKVDYFATVRFETNRYSVPVPFAGRLVTVKAGAFEVKIYHRGEEIARHPRSYGKYQTVYDLKHYLPLLERRPRAVKQARPVQQAEIPQELWEYASRLKNPDRGMVRLLRLLVDHGAEKLLTAVKRAADQDQYSEDVVQYYTTATEPTAPLALPGPKVKPVDLKAYDRLFAGGGTR